MKNSLIRLWQKITRVVKLKKRNGNTQRSSQYSLTPDVITEKDGDKENPAFYPVRDIGLKLSDENVKNIALTGPYGSGKSSVLLTLQKKYSSHNYLNISLATLECNKETHDNKRDNEDQTTNENQDSNDGGRTEDSLNRLIEYSILQQLIYREEPKQIPQSRLKRIKHISNKNSWWVAVVAVLCPIAVFVLFEPSFLRIDSFYRVFSTISGWKLFIDIALFIYLGTVGVLSLRWIVINVYNSKLNKLNLKDGEIEIKENTSIFNKHLDEIIYFFQVTKYDVVIIEDLDRFETHTIYLKLRELNNLLNSSKSICGNKKDRKRIVFIYAVRDDVFNDTSRVKFFDYITTVIPIINPSNSCNKLISSLKEHDITNISDDICRDLGFFIDDMRMLKNIINEFIQYREKLGEKLDSAKLLAMVIYKNYHPKDFALLHNQDGLVYKVISNKVKYLKSAVAEKDKKITEIQNEIKELKKHHFPGVESTLHSQYALKYAIEEIRQEIRNHKALPLSEILMQYPADDFIKDVNGNRLITFLLRRGYIDESFYDYISYFYEGIMTASDKDFIFDIRAGVTKSHDYKIQKTKAVVAQIQDYSFKAGVVKNIDITDYLIDNKAEYNDQYNWIIQSIKKGKEIPFVHDYYRYGRNKELFFDSLLSVWYSFFESEIINCKKEEHSSISYEIFLNYFDDNKLSTYDNEHVNSYIAESFGVINGKLNQSKITQGKVETLLNGLSIHFTSISGDDVNSTFMDFIIEKSLYRLNTGNIIAILKYLGVTFENEYNLSSYTTILKSQNTHLIENVNEDIECCIRDVFTEDSKEESENAIIKILENKKIKDETKKEYLSRQINKIENIESVQEEFWQNALDYNLIYATWTNLLLYIQDKNEIDNFTIDFINRNAEELSKIETKSCLKDALFKYSLTNETVGKLLNSSELSVNEKYTVVNSLSADGVKNNASIIGDILLKVDIKEANKEQVLTVMANISKTDMKLKLFLRICPKIDYDEQFIKSCLEYIGREYAVIGRQKGDKIKLQISVGNRKLSEYLEKNKFISKQYEENGMIRINCKNTGG